MSQLPWLLRRQESRRGVGCSHEREAETYQARKKPKFDVEKNWPRHVRSLYARLRTGHCKELGNYAYMIEIADDPFYECGDVETIDHVLCECPILETTRRRLFEGPVSLSQLVTEPEKCRKPLDLSSFVLGRTWG